MTVAELIDVLKNYDEDGDRQELWIGMIPI